MIDRETNIDFNAKSLWHGTSTIWMDSICQSGLGAINIAKEYNLIELLGFLYSEILRLNINAPELESRRQTISAIITGKPLYHDNITLNYKYDGAYVSMSPLTAAKYACSIPIGSELLDYCLFLLYILRKSNIEIPNELNRINIMSMLNHQADPILVEVTSFNDRELVLEDGTNAQAKLHEIRNIYPKLSIEEHFRLIQFSNFKLLKSASPSTLKFYQIDYSGDPFGSNFRPKYTLIK